MSAGRRVLVVDDDPAILRSVRANLAVRGYAVLTAESGEAALDLFDLNALDLVILDLMLPGASGLDVCRTIRTTVGTPILVLSARGEERTKVRALDLGADDFLTKPFGMDELMARVRALLRRPGSPAPPDGVLLVGDLSLDLATRRATKDGVPVDLTAREFDVLAYMMRYAGKVATHRLLLEEVWGPEYRDSVHYLRVFINRLRRKIEDDPSRPTHIVTEPGVGYRILPGVVPE
jgi:two-component system KDP operon response regulator KdpE